MLITLTALPDDDQTSLLQQTLSSNDGLLLSAAALELCMRPNPYAAKGYVRTVELRVYREQLDASWQLIDDGRWLDLVLDADKHICW